MIILCLWLASVNIFAATNDVFPGDYYPPEPGYQSLTFYLIDRDLAGPYAQGNKVADVVSKNRGKIRVKLPSGKAIPGWLKFDDKTLTFTAKAVPDGAFPVEVVLTIGSESFTVIISEKAESNSFI